MIFEVINNKYKTTTPWSLLRGALLCELNQQHFEKTIKKQGRKK